MLTERVHDSRTEVWECWCLPHGVDYKSLHHFIDEGCLLAPRERFELPRERAHAISSRAHYQAMRSRLELGDQPFPFNCADWISSVSESVISTR